MLQVHHEKECTAYPVVCDKCNKDGIPRAKVQLVYMFFFSTGSTELWRNFYDQKLGGVYYLIYFLSWLWTPY